MEIQGCGPNHQAVDDEIPQPVVMYQVMAAEQVPPGPLPSKTRPTAKNEKNQGDHFYERHD
jgi:hypothetical protein